MIKVILTLLVILVGELAMSFINASVPIISGALAVQQLENSNLGYYSGYLASHINGSSAFVSLGMLVLIFGIWASSLKKLASTVAAVLIASVILVNPAQAYYDTRDNPEFVEIRPNETAFLIPLTGANRTTQGQFGSREYLNENKVAAKRVQIPHVLIRNAGIMTADYYVPAARLIVVDRTPYAREWVSSNTRGTSTRDEAFRFETKDSIGIHTGIVITSYVREEDTASFLYWFGVEPVQGDSTRPEVMYASVSRGQTLATIMDTVVRREAQALISREFGNRTLVQAIADKAKIMDAVRESLVRTFAEKGITIGTIGYAESLTFENPAIQIAIDSVVIAERQAAAVALIAPQMDTLRQQAAVRALEALPKLMERWNGQLPNLPSVVSIPPDTLGAVSMLSGIIPNSITQRPPVSNNTTR